MLTYTSHYLRKQSRRTGYYYLPLDKNYYLLCLCTPFVLCAHDHDERGLLLVLAKIILIRYYYAHLVFSLRLLARASCSIHVQKQQTGSSSCPPKKDSRSSCSLFGTDIDESLIFLLLQKSNFVVV